MLSFVGKLSSYILDFIDVLLDFLSFLFTFPSLFTSFFLGLPVFMQIGFSLVIIILILFLVIRIYSYLH